MVKQARCSHILVKDKYEAIELKKQIENGADFAEIAKKKSKCPSGKKGGDLGWFGKGVMVKEFEEASFNGKVGDLIGPVQTQFGWHLILVTGQK